MFNISSFLSRFSKNINTAELEVEQILTVIENKTQIKLQKNDIEIKNNVIYIKASPAIKNKLFIFKESILSEILKNIQTKIVDLK